MLLVENPSTNPSYNHALEEYLLKNFQEDIFMVWRNVPTVLIGKNQDAKAEYNEDGVREKGIRVVRRLSGGGAIYCDLNILQYTLIAPFSDDGINPFLKFATPVVDALKNLGINAEFTGRNDITVEGKKISGNAQYRYNNRVLHHGSILFDVDMDTIGKVLRPNPAKFDNKRVRSVVSRIGTLAEYVDMDITAFMEYLKKHFTQHYNIKQNYTLGEDELREVLRIQRERFDSPSWNFGTPHPFTHKHIVRHDFGTVTYCLEVKDGNIIHAELIGDFFGDKEVSELALCLNDCSTKKEELQRLLEGKCVDDYIRGMDVNTMVEDLLDTLSSS